MLLEPEFRTTEILGVGAVPQRTTILKLHATVFPPASVAEHCTVLVPSGKKLPGGGSQTTGKLVSQSFLATTR